MGYTTKGLTVDEKKLYIYFFFTIHYMGFNNQKLVNILWIYKIVLGFTIQILGCNHSKIPLKMVVSWAYNGIEWGHMGYLPSSVISSTAIAATSSNGADDTGGSPSKIWEY
jgi:hypothetical protein